MAKGSNYVVGYRRKREGKTNYKKRLNLLKSGRSRVVVRKSNKHLTAQIIDYKEDGDLTVASSHSSDLKKFGWKKNSGNIPASYLTGLICGIKGKSKGVKRVIVDIGLMPSVKGNRLYSALKGVGDAGIEVEVDEKIVPPDKRIGGKHIAEHRKDEDITKEFTQVKDKIVKSFSKK